jgi:AcrR family transcriptional regulator
VIPSLQTIGTDTRRLIVESAAQCIRTRGLHKTTIVDVANAAGVSRGTVYAYFKDKRAIIEAVAENASQQFYREMIKAMEGETTLEGQMGAAAVFVIGAMRLEASQSTLDDDERAVLLTKNAGPLLLECIDFFAPYIAAAKVTGEVRRDLDVTAAAEWFARILFSLASTPASALNLNNPEVARRFVCDHVVRGFAPTPPASRRAVVGRLEDVSA